MPITRPIPESAMMVVNRIRKDIPKPKPESFKYRPGGGLRLIANGCCPMGMLSIANVTCPHFTGHFIGSVFKTWMILSTARWWDEQDDEEAAKKELWGY